MTAEFYFSEGREEDATFGTQLIPAGLPALLLMLRLEGSRRCPGNAGVTGAGDESPLGTHTRSVGRAARQTQPGF